MPEIRDPELARVHVLRGLLLSRAAPLGPVRVADAMRTALEMAGEGWELPPLGVIADVCELITASGGSFDSTQLPPVKDLDPTLTRRYEDYLLGKFYADASFQRGADAVLRFTGRDRDRATAYLIHRMIRRTRFDGTRMTPAVIKRLLKQPANEVLQNAWSFEDDQGVGDELIAQTERLIDEVRTAGDLLGPEDLFELESGMALAEFGQRLALRQVLHTAEMLSGELPRHRPRSSHRRYSVASKIQQEDEYPIGGFSSISNRGTIESLVRSELAYIDPSQRPDLFDIKYARNELLYYSRDENQFLRRRMSFVFVLMPDLVSARIKDGELPVQRIIVLLSLLYVAVQQLTQWLSDDSLQFEFLWVDKPGHSTLGQEQQLIDTLLREPIALGAVTQRQVDTDQWPSLVSEWSERTFCQTLFVSTKRTPQDELPANTTAVRIADWTWEDCQNELQQWMQTWCV